MELGKIWRLEDDNRIGVTISPTRTPPPLVRHGVSRDQDTVRHQLEQQPSGGHQETEQANLEDGGDAGMKTQRRRAQQERAEGHGP